MEPYQKLEREYAKFVGSKYAVSCSSGTAALHLGLLALGVGKGNEVIVPDFTMAACAFAVSYCGAKPVFVDVLPHTYGINPALIEKAITKRTKAIMVVHVYGRLADIDAVVKIARKYNLPVIEDACEAQGAVFKSKADITAYSFYRNKIIAAEEGGIVTTNIKRYAEVVGHLKNMAFGPAHDYFHKTIGYNYRMPNAEATIALENLKRYTVHAEKRKLIESWYDLFLKKPMTRRHAVWFYEVAVPKTSKSVLLKKISAARHSFKPLSTFPMYGSNVGGRVARALSESLVLLPATPALTRQEVRKICDTVNLYL